MKKCLDCSAQQEAQDAPDRMDTLQESSMPKKGEIWYSPLVGYKVRVAAISADRRIIVTDGSAKYTMLLSHFEDTANQWRRLK